MSSDDHSLPISVVGGHQLGINTAVIRANAASLNSVLEKILQVRRIASQAANSAATLPQISVTQRLVSALQMLAESAIDLSLRIGLLQNNLLLAAARYENCEARSRQIVSSLDVLSNFLAFGLLPGVVLWKKSDESLDDSALWVSQNDRHRENSFLAALKEQGENGNGLIVQFLSARLAQQIAAFQGPGSLWVAPKIDGKSQKVSAPLNISGLVSEFNQAKAFPDHGELRVVKYRTGNRVAWRVDIRGTQVWTVTGANPQDMRTNLQTNASGRAGNSDMTNAVTRALDQAGYRRGQPVELIGHSQGGAVAAQLGANPALAKKYNIKSVVTLGSNTGSFRPASGVHMVSLENSADIVPRLDGQRNPNVPNLTTVRTYKNYHSVGGNHAKELYGEVAKAWERSGDGDYARFIETRNHNLGINRTTKATAQSFVVQRMEAPRPANPRTIKRLISSFYGVTPVK